MSFPFIGRLTLTAPYLLLSARHKAHSIGINQSIVNYFIIIIQGTVQAINNMILKPIIGVKERGNFTQTLRKYPTYERENKIIVMILSIIMGKMEKFDKTTG